ncbi:MAG: nitrous oxide-stimulated promoter family protein [Bacteroidales bacterium]|nr:nitrous oxide-stimulated promoter family protein [Bacteroidales bacterium]MBD5223822.1 nitrous oxide-stimulated promoter family protein [Bacteroidales bacterium]MBD5302278.1 nitrous oxide-stimulated promoter family protein [Bacteroides sp.]
MKRKIREKEMLTKMISYYCRKHHGVQPGGFCKDCGDLLNYAHKRIDSCPKGDDKLSCKKCTIHCYQSLQREKIRVIMRYVGPRMIYIHPIFALRHLFNELRPTFPNRKK